MTIDQLGGTAGSGVPLLGACMGDGTALAVIGLALLLASALAITLGCLRGRP